MNISDIIDIKPLEESDKRKSEDGIGGFLLILQDSQQDSENSSLPFLISSSQKCSEWMDGFQFLLNQEAKTLETNKLFLEIQDIQCKILIMEGLHPSLPIPDRPSDDFYYHQEVINGWDS